MNKPLAMRIMGIWLLLIALPPVAVAAGAARSFTDMQGETAAAAPGQPAAGPGGADYAHADITMFHYGRGNGEYWIFEPAAPVPDSAPVIIFSHGWAAMYPKMYGAWIRHLVLKGNIVIYPRYQANVMQRPPEMWRAARDAVRAAFAELQKPGHVRPDLERVAAAGHSFGGVMTANWASVWAREGVPRVKAAMPVQPGDTESGDSPRAEPGRFGSIREDYAGMDPQTRLIVLAGEDDRIVGQGTARFIFEHAVSLPADNKSYILMLTDMHGTPPLVADHFQPLSGDPALDYANEAAPERTDNIIAKWKQSGKAAHEDRGGMYARLAPDAHDFAMWRLFDALCDCAFYGKNCEQSLGSGPGALGLGQWSDGTPVKPLNYGDTILNY